MTARSGSTPSRRPARCPSVDDTLHLYFLCAHPDLTPSSAVALTLRAVGGLTTRQIAEAYLVPESTMAQRISRAKRTVATSGLQQPGDVRTVMRVLYLVFNEGYSGDVDLAAEAIRLTRQLAAALDEPEVQGLLALMLLHHARRASRTGPDGRLVPLADQDRALWDRALITEGTGILQAALARDRLGEYQAQAAIAALHADATGVADTDWAQIVEWYDELLRFADTPDRPAQPRRGGRRGPGPGCRPGRPRRDRGGRAPARRRRRPPPRARRRPRARRPPLRRRRPERAEPRRARPPAAPGGAPEPAAGRRLDRAGRRLTSSARAPENTRAAPEAGAALGRETEVPRRCGWSFRR